MSDDFEEISKWVWFWTFTIIAMSVVFGLYAAIARPLWLGFEHKAFTSSHQYAESAREELLTLATEYDRLQERIDGLPEQDEVRLNLERQQDTIVERLRRRSEMIDSSDVPASARRVLEAAR